MIGRTISHYKILAKVCEDGTGTLYRAVHTEFDCSVAFKALHSVVTDDPERRQRVEADALGGSRLDHPNIARIFGFFHSDGVDFAILEAIEGQSLYDLLERKRPRRRELVGFARQMANALAAAHGAGIIHGPLNPACIVINAEQQLKFYDLGFGAIDPLPESEDARRSFAGQSAPYFSPEQVNGEPLDARSDIFSLGALLYHMTTGKRAFRAGAITETWKTIVETEPSPVGRITSRAPRGMGLLIERCLHKDPQRRFQQVSEIEPLLATMAEAYDSDLSRRVPALWRNRWRLARTGGIALAATAAVVAGVYWKQSESGHDAVIGMQFRQITKNSGYDTEPAASLDGRQLAYASDRSGDGNLDIWVESVDSSEARQLTADPADDREPAFSPDGATVAFRSDRDGGGVYVVPSKGGEERLIAPQGHRPRYSPDGQWIAYWVGPADFAPKPEGSYRIFVIPSSGGEPRQIRSDFASCRYPTWSPDSKKLLFLGRPAGARGDPDASDWWLTSLDGDDVENTRAVRLFHREGILPARQDGIPGDWRENNIFFSTPSTEASTIWRAQFAHGSRTISTRPVRVTAGKSIDVEPSTTVNGRIVFSKQSYNADIWGIPVAANQGKMTGAPKRWTHHPGADLSPSLSADGRKLIFQSNRTGHHNLWLFDLASGQESAAMTSPQEQLWPQISPDGSKVAFSEMRIRRFEHFYKPLGDGAAEILCEDCGPTISGWSPDGRMVLIDSVVRGTRSRLGVALIELSSRKRTMLIEDSRYDLHQARFSSDGRWIAFAARGDGGSSRLYLAPFYGEKPATPAELVALTDGRAWDAAPLWSPDGRLVYFASTRDGYRCIWAQRLNAFHQPSGNAFVIAHLHSARCQPTIMPFDNMDLFLGRDQILLSLGDQTGNIWSARISD